MSNQVQRLRYYDGEYLRSYDFADEQAYHIEMRRRLNLSLHLGGIVCGLQLVKDQDSVEPDAVFYSISPGMAIDQMGREILVPAPYSLSAENILNRPGLTKGNYELWLCYQETQTGLPAAGYRDCNAKDQQTRWQESFQVLLKLLQNPTSMTFIPPDRGGVCLGVVTLTLDSIDGLKVFSVHNEGRTYVGIRTQRVIAADKEAETFKMADQNVKPPKRVPLPGYVDVQPGVLERGNLIVEQNIVIGDDFAIDPTKMHPQQPIPPTGNLKITSDLFLNGAFYGCINGEWYGLKQYIQSLMPDVQASFVEIPISPDVSHPTTNTVSHQVKTTLPGFSFPPKVMVALQWIDWQDHNTLVKWFGAPSLAGNIELRLVAVPQKVDTQTIDLQITWTIAPVATLAGVLTLPVTMLKVGYVVIFQP